MIALSLLGCAEEAEKKVSPREAEMAEAAKKKAEPAPAPAESDKKNKIVEQAAAPPAGRPRPKDLSKWELADLKASLTKKELPFAMAAVLYSAQKAGDAKRAADLDDLLRQAGKMADDPTISLPLVAAGSAPVKPSTTPGARPFAPAAAPAMNGPKFRFAPPSQIRIGKGR